MSEPLFPSIVLSLREHIDKPVGLIAYVRRNLQKAGHGEAALKFTEEAFAAEPEEILGVASRYVTIED
ncbi:MAG: hypothetical protein K0U98_02715 [Deltaproteobacteria bacterium]|nr:hypothetical protein [Deltaproteobacteria bacterium]